MGDGLLMGTMSKGGGDGVNDSINKVAIDAITIIHHLRQHELARLLMQRYEELTKNV
tara:strand:+ start:354 stop:524 length:171 start_codon:yes stop_codon:yes gene_type:complete